MHAHRLLNFDGMDMSKQRCGAPSSRLLAQARISFILRALLKSRSHSMAEVGTGKLDPCHSYAEDLNER